MICAVSIGTATNTWQHLLANEGAQTCNVCIRVVVDSKSGGISKGVYVKRKTFKYAITIWIFMATSTAFGSENVSAGGGIACEGYAA